MLEQISTDLVERLNASTLDPEHLQGRAAFRCTSPDYLPIVGPLAESQAFTQAYSALSKDARQVPDCPCRSEEHTSELQSLMRISYAVFCLKKKNKTNQK